MRKPFNLTQALAGHTVVNGSGDAVEHLAYFPNAVSPYKIFAMVVVSGEGNVESYTEDGKYSTSPIPSPSDLFMLVPDPPPATKPTSGTIYVNVWRNDDVFGVIHATTHATSAQAAAERTTSCSGKKKIFLGQRKVEF